MCLAYAPTVSDSNHMLFFFLLHLDSLLRNSVETSATQSYLHDDDQGHVGSLDGTKGKAGQGLEE